jgi:hypothetical protein
MQGLVRLKDPDDITDIASTFSIFDSQGFEILTDIEVLGM